jgi:hypothetical protein
MTDQTPKEAGFYWAKYASFDWAPVEVYGEEPYLSVLSLGVDDRDLLEDYTWGPRITLPDELERAK